MRVRDVTSSIRWTDHIYAKDHSVTPVLSFPQSARRRHPYTETALTQIDWIADCVAQYVPMSSPLPQDEGMARANLRYRVCVSISG